MTFKFIKTETKIVRKVLGAHGFKEVSRKCTGLQTTHPFVATITALLYRHVPIRRDIVGRDSLVVRSLSRDFLVVRLLNS